MHYRLSCRHFYATHTTSVLLLIQPVFSILEYDTFIHIFVKLQHFITATFVCFLDNQQWIIHYWNILYFSFNRLCTSTGVGSSYSRVTSLLSWIVIYRTQPSPQMNEYKTWIKWTNESAKAYFSCYIPYIYNFISYKIFFYYNSFSIYRKEI